MLNYVCGCPLGLQQRGDVLNDDVRNDGYGDVRFDWWVRSRDWLYVW